MKGIASFIAYLACYSAINICHAQSYTPNDLVEGRLPSNDPQIELKISDNDWVERVYLPVMLSGGDGGERVTLETKSAKSSYIYGKIVGLKRLELNLGEKLELTYNKKIASWVLLDEGPTKYIDALGQIPNDKKYITYTIKDESWVPILYLPQEPLKTEKIIIRSESEHDTYLDNSLLEGYENKLLIQKYQFVTLSWNPSLEHWRIEEQSGNERNSLKMRYMGRDIVFLDFKIDTSTQGTQLYNNGRMQKPIVVSYKACEIEEYENPNINTNCSPITLTKEEIKWYIRLSEHGRNDSGLPSTLQSLYPNFKLGSYEDPKYSHTLPFNGREVKKLDKIDSYESKGYQTLTLWLKYSPDSINDNSQLNLNLCVYSIWEDPDHIPVDYYNTSNCSSTVGPDIRALEIKDGRYEGSLNYVHGITTNDDPFFPGICKNEHDCKTKPGWLVKRPPIYDYDFETGTEAPVFYGNSNIFTYFPSRPGHKFNPLEALKVTRLSVGCIFKKDNDIYCRRVKKAGYAQASLYQTDLIFGDAAHKNLSYSSTYDWNNVRYEDRWTWKFDRNYTLTDYTGSFSVSSVLPVLDLNRDASVFVIWYSSGDTKDFILGNESQSKPIETLVEDNYGNRFKFSAVLYPEPNTGATAGDGKYYALTRVKDVLFTPIL
ncbi:hypothetical protein ACOB3G_001325 [Vibrio cholerae]|nr:hypothetical protein [Vibrio cholerae]HAS3162788.1 hypothetical protein [Vibrio cholerae]